jgi:glucose/arabinose dehydrogenase
MKRFIYLLVITAAITGCAQKDAISQQPGAPPCDLIGWQRDRPPHTERTLETFPPLRDTMITLNGRQHKVSLPEGFTMSVFSVQGSARNVVVSPEGVLYLATPSAVFALPDHDHNGVADSSIQVCSGLHNGFGIGFYKGTMYVSEESAFYRVEDANGDRKAESLTKIYSLSGGGNHRTRNFVIDTTGSVFIQVGSSSNDDEDDFSDSTRGTILVGNVNGAPLHIFARGLRNAVGLDLDPRTGALWANQNGSDNMFSSTIRTDNNPSECVFIVCEGAHYGWPYAYGYQMRNPKYLSKDTNFIRSLSGPVAEVLAHEAPLGLHFYRGSNFPSHYHNAIFQSYHGSWNRTTAAPPRVTVLWADSDGGNAHVSDFINGFQPDSSAGSRWGRTVGLTEGADGALYVADDMMGAIYRVMYTGSAAAATNGIAQSRTSILSINPNPASEHINVSVELPTARSVAYEIVDMLGKAVYSASTLPLAAGAQVLELGLPKLMPGSYILRIIGHDGSTSRGFVVE